MTNEEQMELYGITEEKRVVYLYKTFKYDKLTDAVKYAKIDAIVMKNTSKAENAF
tara:strand:- start:2732 stop:2896 length:165 start_codon:yes stop_codon:yes gene_type:complete